MVRLTLGDETKQFYELLFNVCHGTEFRSSYAQPLRQKVFVHVLIFVQAKKKNVEFTIADHLKIMIIIVYAIIL